MKIAVLSDIHSNHLALKACLDHAASCHADLYLFLGDYAGELPHPQKTMELLYTLMQQHDCRFIRGNREEYWADYEARGKTGWKAFDTSTGCLFYTYHHLSERDLTFFRSLPPAAEVRFPALPAITLCHGSPRKTNEQLLPGKPNTRFVLKNEPNAYLLCGHTHAAGKLRHGGTTLLNPGSVGLSHGSREARYLMLESRNGQWLETFHAIPYDTEAMIAEIDASGLGQRAPWWCEVTKQMLRGGSVTHDVVLQRAVMLCRAETDGCPEIHERHWEQAVRELLSDRT